MKLLILMGLFIFTSCAKVSYIFQQGVGQVALEYNDIDNEDFLLDPNQSDEHKEKVRVILKAKKFFYSYFKLKETSIYDEVKILDQPAVTYLVIHANDKKIKPIKTSFPIVGSFPYLGFFKKSDADKYVNEKKQEGFQTFIRPVYAYSTLNHPLWPFHDNILSSFFSYNERSLTELIFHELVHTIVFVGDNIQFNENLAQFISEKLTVNYFKNSDEQLLKIKARQEKNRELNRYIVSLSKELQKLYDKADGNYLEIQKDFLTKKFMPKVKRECRRLGFKQCWPLKQYWNNARFAALGTYEGKRDLLGDIYHQSNLSLKEFVIKLIELEKKYDQDKMSFTQFLKKEL